MFSRQTHQNCILRILKKNKLTQSLPSHLPYVIFLTGNCSYPLLTFLSQAGSSSCFPFPVCPWTSVQLYLCGRIQVLLSLFRFLSFPPQFLWKSSSFQLSPQFLCWTSSRRPAQMARRRRRSEEGFTFWELLTWRNATICKFVTVISGMISVNSYMIWVSKLCSTGSLGIARWKGKGAILEMTKGS